MTQQVEIGTELDFTKTSGWSTLGVAVVTGITYGRVKNTYLLTTVREGKVGASFKAPVRHGNFITAYGTIVGKNTGEAKKVREERAAREEKRYEAAEVAKQWFEAGDIVRISSRGLAFTSWTMKVLEIDTEKGKIKGVCGEFSQFQVGSKMASASLTNADTVITLVTKQGFDPETDLAVKALYNRRAVAANRRATTRSRNTDLRNHFGW